MDTATAPTWDDLADAPELRQFFTLVRDLTGVGVTLANPAGERGFAPAREESPLCRLLHGRVVDAGDCLAHDRNLCRQAAETRQTEYGLCPAGLKSLAIPIVFDERHLATLVCGHAVPEEPSEADFLRVLERFAPLNIPTVTLRRAYFASPHLSSDQVESFSRLCAFYVMQHCEQARRLQAAGQSSERRDIARACRYLQQHFHDTVTLEATARHIGLSPAYFSMLFKRETGTSHTEYLQALRVTEACRLLTATAATATAIARELGFHSLTHFTRVFKQATGNSPGAYRRLMRPPAPGLPEKISH